MLALPSEDKGHGNISMATYCKYFMAGGNILVLALMIVLFTLAEVRNNIYCTVITTVTFMCVYIYILYRVELLFRTGGYLTGDIAY